jgi:hypothetical protein
VRGSVKLIKLTFTVALPALQRVVTFAVVVPIVVTIVVTILIVVPIVILAPAVWFFFL